MAALTGKHFNLSKSTKCILGALPKGARGLYKKMMIDAEHTYITQRTRRYKEPGSKGE